MIATMICQWDLSMIENYRKSSFDKSEFDIDEKDADKINFPVAIGYACSSFFLQANEMIQLKINDKYLIAMNWVHLNFKFFF